MTTHREVERRSGPSVALAVDETFTLVAENGAPLLELVRSTDGPVVRLLHADAPLAKIGQRCCTVRVRGADALAALAARS
jgi:hypothetical protein